jgi:hypothetical protein
MVIGILIGIPTMGGLGDTTPPSGPTPDPGYVLLTDPDGAFLTDPDGAYLQELA